MNRNQELNSPTLCGCCGKQILPDQEWTADINGHVHYACHLAAKLSQLETSHLNLKAFLADVESVKQEVENERDVLIGRQEEWRACATSLAEALDGEDYFLGLTALARFNELSKSK